jgi:hypothetical protein
MREKHLHPIFVLIPDLKNTMGFKNVFLLSPPTRQKSSCVNTCTGSAHLPSRKHLGTTWQALLSGACVWGPTTSSTSTAFHLGIPNHPSSIPILHLSDSPSPKTNHFSLPAQFCYGGSFIIFVVCTRNRAFVSF